MWSDHEKTFRNLLEDTKDIFPWSWEDRFICALGQFRVEDSARVFEILENSFIDKWDSPTIGEATKRVQLISLSLGGIRPGQLLFSTDPNQNALVLGALWPWGNGKVTSIRVIPNCDELPDSEKKDFIASVRNWFAL
ncbi:MAG: hypothetical protein GY847_30145 [Proteobacteria bacterium]|nr:hypothetical protein [Pseudomonadota bacterium]